MIHFEDLPSALKHFLEKHSPSSDYEDLDRLSENLSLLHGSQSELYYDCFSILADASRTGEYA